MKHRVRFSISWRRQAQPAPCRRFASSMRSVETAIASPLGHPDIQAFRQRALLAQVPLYFHKDAGSPTSHLPALTKWFADEPANTPQPLQSQFVSKFQDWPFPYELVRSSADGQDAVTKFRDSLMASSEMTDQIMAGILQSAVSQSGDHTFFQVYAPLKLLIKALEFNALPAGRESPLQLYIAQCALPDLPQELQDDLPAPDLVRRAGKGDIYNSSIWLGTEPTYTPLHRDPNPNLFCQLHSRKTVRLLPPALGDRLFFEVQVQIRQQGNSRIRSTDMMEGEERQALHDAVWVSDSLPEEALEAELDAGDALFIPKGWWHSVKSVGSCGQLNGSVNWWFR